MAKIGSVWVDNQSFLEKNEYLSFDKILPSQVAEEVVKAKFVIYDDEFGFKFTSSKGITKTTNYLHTNTSEYKILMYLVENHRVPVEVSNLINQLIDPRRNSDEPDGKQRVLDKITAIRKKLGSELIKTTSKGYKIDCEITRT